MGSELGTYRLPRRKAPLKASPPGDRGTLPFAWLALKLTGAGSASDRRVQHGAVGL